MEHSSRWTDDEDKLLVDSPSELNVSGMKVDTGFKVGYLDKLEKIMLEKFPNCGKKAKPQIQNRVKYLKKQAMALSEMVAGNGSGFGWDDVHQKLVCDKAVYLDWCKSHPTAQGLYDKKFPHFQALVEIYAGDRANGNNATAPGDTEQQVEADVQCSQRNTLDLDDNDDAQDDTMDGASATGDAPPILTTSGGLNGKRKRSNSGSDFYWSTEKLANNLASMCEAMVPYLATLTAVLSQESVCNKEISKELRKIQGLSHRERVMASDTLTTNSQCTVLFLDTPDEEKADFVADLCGFTR